MGDLRVPDLNVVHIAGRLTRDPELKYTSGNRAYVRFGLANTRYYRTKDGERREDTTFVNGSAWDKQAEWIGERLKKGRPILVEGTLRSYDFEDSATGQKVTKLEISARRVTPLDWDDDGSQRGGGSASGGGGAEASRPQQYERPATPKPREIEEPLPEDDIPF